MSSKYEILLGKWTSAIGQRKLLAIVKATFSASMGVMFTDFDIIDKVVQSLTDEEVIDYSIVLDILFDQITVRRKKLTGEPK